MLNEEKEFRSKQSTIYEETIFKVTPIEAYETDQSEFRIQSSEFRKCG